MLNQSLSPQRGAFVFASFLKNPLPLFEVLLPLAKMKKKTETWLTLAENDLEFAKQILQNKQRPYFACNECHQAIEKILKAIIQEKTNEIPPRTHNLFMLAKLTKISFSEDQNNFLLRLNPHYMGTRYPDDLVAFQRQYTKKYAAELFHKTEELFLWLKNFLIPKK